MTGAGGIERFAGTGAESTGARRRLAQPRRRVVVSGAMTRHRPTAILAAVACAASALALAGAASPAHAADATVAADPAAEQVTALDGTIVWVTAAPGGGQRLLQQRDGVTGPVPGAPVAGFYRSIDLGHDTAGRLVLTYRRCETLSRCVSRRDDLAGHRASIRGLGVRGCSPTTAPALWRTRAAYGMACRRGNRADDRRSGVYVKTGSRAPRRMPRPADAARFGVSEVDSVDLRGTRVAAILSDIFSYAAVQDVDGRHISAFLAGASEGDSDEHARGLALGTGGALWSLTTAEHAGDPLQTVLNWLRGTCREFEVLSAPPGAEAFPAIDLAVDGTTAYLVVPGTGIVRHDLAPQHPCP